MVSLLTISNTPWGEGSSNEIQVSVLPLDFTIQHLDVLIEASRLPIPSIYDIIAHACAIRTRISGPILPAEFPAQI